MLCPHMPHTLPFCPCFDHPNNILWRFLSCTTFFMSFSPSCSFLSLGSKYSHQHFVLICPHSVFLSWHDKILCPYEWQIYTYILLGSVFWESLTSFMTDAHSLSYAVFLHFSYFSSSKSYIPFSAHISVDFPIFLLCFIFKNFS